MLSWRNHDKSALRGMPIDVRQTDFDGIRQEKEKICESNYYIYVAASIKYGAAIWQNSHRKWTAEGEEGGSVANVRPFQCETSKLVRISTINGAADTAA